MRNQKKYSSSEDPIFGQSPVFALDDAEVDPEVIRYLQNVRKEAIATNATQAQNFTRIRGHDASIYDDTVAGPQEAASQITEQHGQWGHVPLREDFVDFGNNMEKGLQSFNNVTEKIFNESFTVQAYEKDHLDLLLYYMKLHLEKIPEKKGIVAHILNLLKEYTVSEDLLNENDWTIDEEWFERNLGRLRSLRIRTIEDIKISITGDFSDKEPMGLKQWTQFIRENEPLHSMFCTMINAKNIWVLVQFMSQEWIKEITKEKPYKQRVSQWLFYILAHLPTKVTATQTSLLRTLGKKCQKQLFVKTAERGKGTLPISTEMKQLKITFDTVDIDILELVVAIMAMRYGQRDLIEFLSETKN
ncbi:hypothetical protein KAFR_0H01010 [Kazachstania africana CBS 2517]|uniref:Pre-mRNA-splicing factor BRR1 n=1 Tax=Kazachstania africana (strain ATCC 22294 / BCRC 22015 / CBS 2517 / CECT 1963 / NBRC 1671 / NRRL Y-8276) TaxID=1071382 RepID=H2AYV5_KAZAF|nr:hypothetical protein KAFR_0H01010 [Kazachstania africana CBS 2517]CCF59511.1 hypothetical protein KAFR_0H01010 [Kazachstania africana CBS 2517]